MLLIRLFCFKDLRTGCYGLDSISELVSQVTHWWRCSCCYTPPPHRNLRGSCWGDGAFLKYPEKNIYLCKIIQIAETHYSLSTSQGHEDYMI